MKKKNVSKKRIGRKTTKRNKTRKEEEEEIVHYQLFNVLVCEDF